ncbi:hypothetical protein GOQ27_13920 [Clostridium sp. D2Q-11]|uniref:Uncharacterized protein n=1 Tax=Anaeromonas frigoriresistens TaxID=2683708 RepID=A0A942V448_9FIRM|nr:hypothetical protein [Anaeromonas frigoriresistens]MBS4539567.1 hypothetical protein [Anaeromonas frigoriresistens]
MRVSGVNNLNSYYLKPNTTKIVDNNDNFEVKNISHLETDKNDDIWKRLGEKYDVTNATFEEICEIGKELYKAKEITLLELGHLTLDLSRLPGVKENSFIYQFYKGRKNWIEAFKDRAKNQLSFGNMSAYHDFMKCAQYLRRIEA